MTRSVFSVRHGNIEIEAKPLAKGGEGAVHKILYPGNLKAFCVKLYFSKYQTEERRKKIEFMVDNPPPNFSSTVYMVCWPNDLIYDTNKPQIQHFIGFLMPMAWPENALLYGACIPRPSPRSPPWLSMKFDRTTPEGQAARLKLIVNIASALHSIHALNKYVLVDMKPQNILLTEEAKIAIVDLDSIQIADGATVLFKAQVATPEYTPPEAAAISPKSHCIQISWDRFSMAIMFYQLLLGLHPYQASFKNEYAEITTPSEAIKQGLFVHGSKRHYIDVLPPPHRDFDRLNIQIKRLFMRAFDSGFRLPQQRPSASEWGKTLYSLLIPASPRQADETFLTPHTQKLLNDRINIIQSLI